MMTLHLKSTFINEAGTVGRGQYRDGSLALLFSPDTGEPAWALSTNLVGHGLHAPDGHVFIKGYAEHDGLCQCLVDNGVVERVREVTFGPYDTTADLVKVLV